MSDENLLAALGEIVQEATGIPAVRVVPAASFVDDLDIDSLSLV
jgi:acyl carrier protein